MTTSQQILDIYFLDARAKLIEIAAFMDRVGRAAGEPDFRFRAFEQALQELHKPGNNRAERVQLAFSDPSTAPIAKAATKAACGAYKNVETQN